jgi:hypothetical protein
MVLYTIRKGTPNKIFRAEFHKDLHQRVKEGSKSRIRGRNESAINTKKDKRPSIFTTEQEAVIDAIQKLPTTGVRGVIFTYLLTIKPLDGRIWKQPQEKSEDQKD